MAIIRVSGPPRAGKTSTSDLLAPSLGYENHYTGAIFEALAKEKGMTKDEFFKAIASNPELEKEIDRKQEELMMSRDNIVIQGRMAPFLRTKPGAKVINVLITASLNECARREMLASNGRHASIEDAKKFLQERILEERLRYRKLYGIYDYLDKDYFDVVIDTTHLNPDQVFDILLAQIKKYI